MKHVTYQNVMLTIIAACLITMTLFICGVITPVKVTLQSSKATVDINIESVGGQQKTSYGVSTR